MNREKMYEIFRACRLCGVGAGYKMPIIQNIIDVENEEIELRQKIKECVQIEVNLHEPMPPLICELCVDKVQDFYEFRKMCHETNRKTRQRLGLPCKSLASESILGVTEALNSDSDDGEPLVKQPLKKPRPKSSKAKKEDDLQIKPEAPTYKERSSRSSSVEVSDRGGKGQTTKKAPRRSEVEELQELLSHASTSTRLRPAPKSVHRNIERDISDSESDASISARSKPAPKSVKRNLDISDTESLDDNSLLRPKRAREVSLESTMVKKSRASMEAPKPERTQKAGPKSSKETVLPTPLPKTTKPGPKSKKLDTTQIPPKIDTSKSKNDTDAKSKKAESVPMSKSKSEVTKSKAGPKSRMREPSPVAPQKTKMAENVVSTASKGKKREETSPAPRSKKQRDASPKPDSVQYECKICDTKVKSLHGLVLHVKVHVVTYTPPELACNACEMWFPSAAAAGNHTRQHNAGQPYTCNKCYDDFRTNADYEMHFTRKQCIPTYEVADVKCDSCWKYFPTYKLLEEHRCAGEGGRPGGKCSTCKRAYATIKGLRTHEFRCTQKKKVEPKPKPEEAPPEVAKGMLPMYVRIVRCDTLLDISEGHYDVSGLSHRFGLDRHSTYPYFYSMGNVKSEPSTSFNHMVAIDDDIKQEYLKDDMTEDSFIHWDSDSETNSETDDVSSPKSVRSLSSISLKTLFSPKCLGKVPKRQRKVKPEPIHSILSIDFTNVIHNNLGHESNHSGDNDSDSILDKSVAKKDGTLKENVTPNVENYKIYDGLVETTKSDEEDGRKADAQDDNMNDTEKLDDKETLISENQKDPTNSSQDKKREKVSEPTQDITRTEHLSNSESLQNTNEDTESRESIGEPANIAEESQSDCKTSPENEQVVSNETVCADKIVDADNNEVVTELQNPDVEMSEQQDELVSNNTSKFVTSDTDSQLSEINEPNEVSNGKQTEDCTDAPTETVNETIDSDLVTTDKCDDSSINETVNDVTPVTEENINENNHPFTTTDKMDENDHSNKQGYETNSEETKKDTENDDEELSTKDDDTNTKYITGTNSDENLIKNETADTESNNYKGDMSKEEDNTNKETNSSRNSGESLITENDLFSSNIQSVDKFNISNLDEEEKLLMAELDAQIGENLPDNFNSENESQKDNSDTFGENNFNIYNSEVSGENSNNVNENTNIIGDSTNTGELSENTNNSYTNTDFAISNKGFEEDKTETLDVLLKKGDDLKSLDLDSISDEEFNFDI